MEARMMMRTETLQVWVPVFDYDLCSSEFGFTVIGQPDKRRASIRSKVEELAKNAAKVFLSQHGVQVLEIGDCGPLGYDSENYLGVRVKANVEIPGDVVECADFLKRLPRESLREQVQMLYEVGDKHHARRFDIRATLIGDFFVDGYCLSWSAIYRQICIQIRELGSAYISRDKLLSLARSNVAGRSCARLSFLQYFESLFGR
jgi:hypothetical protein